MEHSGHHHDHSLVGKKLWVAIILNSFVTLAQGLAGFFSGSLALLSDALHNLSDVVALLLSYFAIRFANRESTPAKTFGYKRGEILAAFINTASLMAVAVFLCKEAIERLVHPVEVDPGPLVLLGGLSILVNVVSVVLLRSEAQHSLNIRSAYLHLFSDILSSIAVVIGGILIYWTHLYWIDSILTIAIACYLVLTSWRILMDIMRIIMHFTPNHLDLKELERELLSEAKLVNVHHIHVWQLNDREIHFEAHVDFGEDLALSEVSQIISALTERLREKFGIHHTVIQPEIGILDSKNLIVSECHP